MNISFEDSHLRQLDIIHPEKLEFNISIIGGGAIGSFSALALAKMGCQKITVWDDDTVETHNIGNQLSGVSDIEKPKTYSINRILKNLCGLKIKQEKRKYLGQELTPGVVIVGSDNMISRKIAFENVSKSKSKIDFFIDGRMGAEFLRIYSFNPFKKEFVERYLKTLYSDEEAEDLPCSGRSIIYCPFIIAGIICSIVKKFAKEEMTPFEILFDIKKNLFLSKE